MTHEYVLTKDHIYEHSIYNRETYKFASKI